MVAGVSALAITLHSPTVQIDSTVLAATQALTLDMKAANVEMSQIIGLVSVGFTAKKPSMSFTAGMPGVSFTGKKPNITFSEG